MSILQSGNAIYGFFFVFKITDIVILSNGKDKNKNNYIVGSDWES